MWDVGGLDRIVTVENTSKSALSTESDPSDGVSVYIRTIFAFENPNDIVNKLILLNYNADEDVGTWEDKGDTKINSETYRLFVYTYKNALAPGATTPPSLKQVVLKAEATNEDVAVLNGGLEMMVVSEAVEVSAGTSAFNEVTATSNPWVGTYKFNDLVSSVSN